MLLPARILPWMSLSIVSARAISSSTTKITLSDGRYLLLPVGELTRLNISKPQPLTERQFKGLLFCSLLFRTREYALRQVALSPKVEGQLTPKLIRFIKNLNYRQKSLFADLDYQSVVSQVIDYLSERQLLDQTDFITSFVRRHARHSKIFILAKLANFGISRPQAISHIPVSHDRQAIIRLLAKVSPLTLKEPRAKNRFLAKLTRLGFPLNEVISIIDEHHRIS